MVIRKLSDKKPKILIFNGSPRRLKSCANQTSKSQKIVQYVIEKWLPFVDFDVIDLSIGKTIIQPCKVVYRLLMGSIVISLVHVMLKVIKSKQI